MQDNIVIEAPVTEADRLLTAWGTLTPREKEVARFIAEGETNRGIAALLDISLKTYDTHRGHILKKLAARHNVDVCHVAIKLGYVTVPVLQRSVGN